MKRFGSKMKIEQAKRMLTYYSLQTQMRVKGGNDYIAYVKEILSGEVKSKKSFANYNLILMTDFTKFNNLMYQKEKEVGLVRMAAGYAWDWLSKNDKTVYDIEIQEIKKQWNHCTEGWVHSENAIDEVGCIHSIPVSYTHLDVYKRQIWNSKRRTGWEAFERSSHASGLCTVSKPDPSGGERDLYVFCGAGCGGESYFRGQSPDRVRGGKRGGNRRCRTIRGCVHASYGRGDAGSSPEQCSIWPCHSEPEAEICADIEGRRKDCGHDRRRC